MNFLNIISQQCLLAGLWKRSGQLPRWPPRDQEVLHQRWISRNMLHVCLHEAWIRLPTLALKPRGDITRSPKQWYQWSYKKLCAGGGRCLLLGGCLVWECLVGGGGLVQGVCGIPACTEADPPLWTESHTSVKTQPCPNFVAGGNKTSSVPFNIWTTNQCHSQVLDYGRMNYEWCLDRYQSLRHLTWYSIYRDS